MNHRSAPLTTPMIAIRARTYGVRVSGVGGTRKSSSGISVRHYHPAPGCQHLVRMEFRLIFQRSTALNVVPKIDVRHAESTCDFDHLQDVEGAKRATMLLRVVNEIDGGQPFRQCIDVSEAH